MEIGTKTLAIPLIQGGMGVGVSLGNLAGHVAKEGAMGVLSTANPGYRESDFWQNSKEANDRALYAEIKKARTLSKGNGLLAVNVMVAGRDYARLVKTALEAGIDAIISGAGLPLELPKLAEGASVLLAPIVSGGRAASTICRAWKKRHDRLPDFVVLEGAEAGGHLGFDQTELIEGKTKPLSQLLQEVLEALTPFGKIPVFVAGGVFSKDEIARYQSEGAAGAQIATPFIATEECDASEEYKRILIEAKEEDICIVKSPVGMPGRALYTPLIKKLEQQERIPPKGCTNCLIPCATETTPYCITRALIEAVQGNYEDGLFFCGANAGKINKMTTVSALIQELTQPPLCAN